MNRRECLLEANRTIDLMDSFRVIAEEIDRRHGSQVRRVVAAMTWPRLAAALDDLAEADNQLSVLDASGAHDERP